MKHKCHGLSKCWLHEVLFGLKVPTNFLVKPRINSCLQQVEGIYGNYEDSHPCSIAHYFWTKDKVSLGLLHVGNLHMVFVYFGQNFGMQN